MRLQQNLVLVYATVLDKFETFSQLFCSFHSLSEIEQNSNIPQSRLGHGFDSR